MTFVLLILSVTKLVTIVTKKRGMYACEFEGTRFDAGDKMGYLKAIIAYGLRHPDLGEQLTKHLKEVVATL